MSEKGTPPPPNLRRQLSRAPHKDVGDYQQFLTANRVTLTRDFKPEAFLDRLRERHYLSEDDAEDILSPYNHPTRRMKVGRLLDVITCKGPDAFDYFMELAGYEYPHIYEEIFQRKPNVPPADYRRHRSSTLAMAAQETLALIHMFDTLKRNDMDRQLRLENVVDALSYVEAEKKDLEREIAYLRQIEMQYEHSKQKLKETDEELRGVKDENRNLLRRIVDHRDEVDKMETMIRTLERTRDETEQKFGEARLQLEQRNHSEALLKENVEQERKMSKRLRKEIRRFTERTGHWETVLQHLNPPSAMQTQLEILKHDLEEERTLNKQLCEELDQTRDELERERELREELHRKLLQAESERERFEMWKNQVERRRDEYFEKINELEKEKRRAEDECNRVHQKYLDEADKRKHLFDKNHTLELRLEHLQRELDEARQENRWNRPRLAPITRSPVPRTPLSPRNDDPFAKDFHEYTAPKVAGSSATLPASMGRAAPNFEGQGGVIMRTSSQPSFADRDGVIEEQSTLTPLKAGPPMLAMKPKTESMKVQCGSMRIKDEDDPKCHSDDSGSDSGMATSQHRSSTTSTASEDFAPDSQQPRSHHLSPAASFDSEERTIDTSSFVMCEECLPEKPEKNLYFRLAATTHRVPVSASVLKDISLTSDTARGPVVSKGAGPIRPGDKISQVSYGSNVVEISRDVKEAAMQLRECAGVEEETVYLQVVRETKQRSSSRCTGCIPENSKAAQDPTAVKDVYVRSNLSWEDTKVDRSIPIREGEILYIEDQEQDKFLWACKVDKTSGRKLSRQVSGRIPSLQEGKKQMEMRRANSLPELHNPGNLGRSGAIKKKNKPKEQWKPHAYVLVCPMKATKQLPVLLFGHRRLVKAALDLLDTDASWAKVFHSEGDTKAPHWNDLISESHHVVLPGNMSLTSRCLHCYVIITLKVMEGSSEAVRQIFGEDVTLTDDEDSRAIEDLHQKLGTHGEQISLLITQKIKDKASFLSVLRDKITKVQQQIFWIETAWPDFQH